MTGGGIYRRHRKKQLGFFLFFFGLIFRRMAVGEEERVSGVEGWEDLTALDLTVGDIEEERWGIGVG